MTVNALVGLALFLTGGAFFQAIAFGLAEWRKARRERQIDDTLGPPAPDSTSG